MLGSCSSKGNHDTQQVRVDTTSDNSREFEKIARQFLDRVPH